MADYSSDENYTPLSPRTFYREYANIINTKNFETYRKFSFLLDKILKLKGRNDLEYDSDLKPLLDTASSLSSFASFAHERFIGTSYSEENLSHIENELLDDENYRQKYTSQIHRNDTDLTDKENTRSKYKVQNLRYNSSRHNFSNLRKDTLKRLPRANKFSSNYPVKPFDEPQKQPYKDNSELYKRERSYEHYNRSIDLPQLQSWDESKNHVSEELFTYLHHRKCNKLDENFSYEQKRILKKKMRDVKKRPETYVIIGMI